MEKKIDIYRIVTERVMEQLSKGVCPWHRPWTGLSDGAINYKTRKPYSLLNQILLGKAGEWLTFNQIKECGGSIKKGAKAGMVVYYSTYTVTNEKKEDGDEKTVTSIREIPILRYYNVFHIDDTTGIESKIKEDIPTESPDTVAEVDDIISDYVQREGIKFHNDKPSNRAFYSLSSDSVTVPMISQYAEAGEYYSTVFHELTHSTIPARRCNREDDNKNHRFGSKDYSREELVAEIGSAMLCNVTNVSTERAFDNSVSYINGWLRALENDTRMIVWAASRAEKAARYILNIKDGQV